MKIKWNKYLVYYLGYLYSDGSIDNYRISMEIIKEDADAIEPFIEKTGLNFTTYERKRKNRKSQKSFWVCDKELCKYLREDMNYINKSKEAPDISNIPASLMSYFMLGLIDGDGCYYLSKDKKKKQFYITSSYNYDWSLIVNLFNDLGIESYTINRVINNKEKDYRSSYIRFTKYDNHVKLYNYLYPNGYEIGLKRKYNKIKEIIQQKPTYIPNKEPLDLEEIKEDLKTMNYIETAKKHNCGQRKIRRFAKKHKIGTYVE